MDVVNSRPAKKGYEVWRRRRCPKCKQLLTTREKIDLQDVLLVVNDSGQSAAPFDTARITISILRVFDSNGLNPSDAHWLAETVGSKLMERYRQPNNPTLPANVTITQLRNTVYETLESYHPVAGLTYGTAHGVITPTNKRRRGRPSLKR